MGTGEKRQLRLLMRHAAWANVRLFDAIAALPGDEATKPRATVFGNMVNTLNHACVVDLVWKAYLVGPPQGDRARLTDTEPGFAEVRAAQQGSDRWYVDYADRLAEDAYGEVLRLRFVDGSEGAMSRGEVLLHVAGHKAFQRGCIAELFFQAGGRPPVTDLPEFLRDAHPDF